MLQCGLEVFTDPGCPIDGPHQGGPPLAPISSTTWKTTSSSWTIPAVFNYATFECFGLYMVDAYIDQAYLNAGADTF
jgi:hypothetical protein